MKVYLTGRNHDSLKELLNLNGIDVTELPEEAGIIITYGGDGAMLGAEQDFPGKLKFPIRDRETAPLCPVHTLETQIRMLTAGRLKLTELPKLEGRANGQILKGVNDIFIHNKNNVSALRYKVWIDNELYGHEIVGDGAGVSTVHGSTAYYRSITHSIFRTGIGLAFSNSTEIVNHLVLPESSQIRVMILRGPAELVADNSPVSIPMDENEEATIRLSGEKTPILGLDIFMCPECRYLRHSTRNSTQNG